jgi:hypothetical protein
VLVAEVAGKFAGFAAGWIVEEENLAETADSNRAGYVSDICVMPAYRGHRVAGELEPERCGSPFLFDRVKKLASARPRISSLLPSEYRFAVSKKLIPASSAFLMNGRLSSSGRLQA